MLACEVSGMSVEATVAYMQEKLESGELKGAAAVMVVLACGLPGHFLS